MVANHTNLYQYAAYAETAETKIFHHRPTRCETGPTPFPQRLQLAYKQLPQFTQTSPKFIKREPRWTALGMAKLSAFGILARERLADVKFL